MFTAQTMTTAQGLTLALDCYGDPGAPVVLLSHGGGQTRHAWGNTAKRLSEAGWYAVSYDHRGHGESDWCPNHDYSFLSFAEDQKCVIEYLGGNVVVVGASLGGVCAMQVGGHLAPGMLRSVILVDITPQMNRDGASKILEFMASNAEDGFATLEEAADVIARYTGRDRPVNPAGLKKNVRLADDGRYYWHWDPAMVTKPGQFGSSNEHLIECCKAFNFPWFLVRGLQSDIVPEPVFKEFRALFPNVPTVTIERARHMVAGDRNDIFADEIITLLNTLPPARSPSMS